MKADIDYPPMTQSRLSQLECGLFERCDEMCQGVGVVGETAKVVLERGLDRGIRLIGMLEGRLE